MILRAPPSRGFQQFLYECSIRGGIDTALVSRVAKRTIIYLHSKASVRDEMSPTQELENRWYAALWRGERDYAVYDSDLYLADLWACWVVYSRARILGVEKASSFAPAGILADVGKVERVVDLGCGFGYTTAAWKELYPNADVIGTNVAGVQWDLAERNAFRHRFRLARTVEQIDAATDLVFASEYFEHFERPILHLNEVLDALRPRALLIANAFGTRSIGHFDRYQIGTEWLDGKATSRRFNDVLRSRGYEKVRTTLWNARPSYWRITTS